MYHDLPTNTRLSPYKDPCRPLAIEVLLGLKADLAADCYTCLIYNNYNCLAFPYQSTQSSSTMLIPAG
jgi:hypothetical protein